MSRRTDNPITIDITTEQTLNPTDVGVGDASTGKRAHSQYEEQVEDTCRRNANASDSADEWERLRNEEKNDRSCGGN